VFRTTLFDNNDQLSKVLYGHENDNGVYSLFVTDYTSNAEVDPIQASWCPSEIAHMVLKVEMWSPSSECAKTMQPGEIYSFCNMRMKVSTGGYIEGSFTEAHKLRRLDLNEAGSEPHLQALLKYVQI
jgi:hypothetical protein